MSNDSRLKVVLYWHMHQPEYRDLVSGEFQLPWTYLHTIKDYVDMAAHLETVPGARVVVNFAPILLEQIEAYAQQVRECLARKRAAPKNSSLSPIRDPLLASLNAPALPADPEHQLFLVKSCMRANEERIINRFPEYQRLAMMARWVEQHPDTMRYMDEQFVVDLLVWYHLAWLGETVRRKDEHVRQLMAKGAHFTLRERDTLLEVIGELLSGVIERYRILQERGQVELSMTPYAHPIVPLLLDLKSAREAMPDVALPLAEAYPEGEERARWHITKGIESFERYFGVKPVGCWPSEGSVSKATLALLEDCGFQWIATGEGVLHNSIERSERSDAEEDCGVYRPFHLPGKALRCFFRSDGLSDLIGFTFSDWHADDAVGHLVHELESIAQSCSNPGERVVSIILDGENAWEYYPENGYYFLSVLYPRLLENPHIELTTFSQCLGDKMPAEELPELVAGSWVYGTFSTWIGHEDKNRGWDMLAEAGLAFRRAVASGRLTGERLRLAERQLAICEGSDWFWWFGDYNPGESVRDFDRMYRMHLANLYQMVGEDRPEYLSHAFTHGGGPQEAGGVMRRGAGA